VKTNRPTWLDINRGHLLHNLGLIRHSVGPERKIIGVVKANAYGHGAIDIARTLLEGGADKLAVATLAEALELRSAAIRAPILVFAGRYGDGAEALWRYDLEAVVFDVDVLESLRASRPVGSGRLKLHLHLETGMGRLGAAPEDARALMERIAGEQAFELVGIMTHLASANASDHHKTNAQITLFDQLCSQWGLPRHAANSAAVAQHPSAYYEAVRPGLALYGVEPVPQQPMGLRPVMSWRTEIAHIRNIAAGASVGYGGRWTAASDSRIAILPVGYADGYPWCAEGQAEVLINGQRVKVIGAVSMDMIALDLSSCTDAKVGDSVVLLGAEGDDEIFAEELALWGSRLVYEVLTGVGSRVPRRLIDEGVTR
jgi:alanine racemase